MMGKVVIATCYVAVTEFIGSYYPIIACSIYLLRKMRAFVSSVQQKNKLNRRSVATFMRISQYKC